MTLESGFSQMKKESLIRQLIGMIGDNPNRPGMEDTPRRVVESWKEFFCGYFDSQEEEDQYISAMLTTFDGIQYSGVVLMRDVEFYSHCEHHMVPFHGKAHIAYIPGGEQQYEAKGKKLKVPIPGEFKYRVVGLSKLARLLEIKSRRFTVQEDITTGICDALEKYLKPLGCACIIEAKHMCVCSRGVNKQHSEMVTSMMTGTFLDSDGTSRNELLSLINMKG